MDNNNTEIQNNLKIELGCGKAKHEGYYGIDSTPFEGVDKVCDIAKEGIPLEDNSADYVYSQDFMEHLTPEKKVFVINEIWRVLKPGGRMEHRIPNAGSRNDFGSPSHLSHWNLQQFQHFDVNSYRYKLDADYEGFMGGFKEILAEEINQQVEYGRLMPQSIHVIYEVVK